MGWSLYTLVDIQAWSSGLVASIVLSCVLLKLLFDVSVGNTILGIVLAFLFSFVGVQASGTVGINPVGPIAKCSQLIFGGVSKIQGQNLQEAQSVSLIAGSLAGQAASHSVDMVADLKIGHLMSAAPKAQFWAQLWGTVFTILPTTGLFVAFTKAYPCITNHDLKCPFDLPAVMAWKMVAIAMTSATSAIPKSSGISNACVLLTSGITAIVLGIMSIITVVIKYRLPPKYRNYVPNWSGIGLGFLIPNVALPFGMVCGAVTAVLMKRLRPAVWELYGYPFAAGLTAGEACSGLLTVGLIIAGVGGNTLGTQIGCPFGSC
jgi:uncharacterized oligopeptide transporter (OPT) family protein